MPTIPSSYVENKKIILKSSNPIISNIKKTTRDFLDVSMSPVIHDEKNKIITAVVYCEENFNKIDGKTANGLIRQSERYKILSVIDSQKAGLDSGVVLDGRPNNIPICHDIKDSLEHAGYIPDYFIFGMAPSSGMLSPHQRKLILEAIDLGMNIVFP
jgi:hypothetical protein